MASSSARSSGRASLWGDVFRWASTLRLPVRGTGAPRHEFRSDIVTGFFADGGTGWLIAICLSRVGAYMVYIAYAAALPVLQGEWHLSGTAAGSIA